MRQAQRSAEVLTGACASLGPLPCRSHCGRQRTPRWLVAASALGLVALTVWAGRGLERQLPAVQDPDLIYLPPTRFVKAVSLGYEHVVANVLWFRTINYFGRHYQSDRVYRWLASMCDAVTDLDPTAEHVYRFGGVILPWEADQIDEGIALLEKGARNLPDSWRIHYMLGFSYYFFKNDLPAATRTLQRTALLPGAAKFVADLAAIVNAADGGPAGAIDFLSKVEQRDVSDEMRDVIRQRIRELSLSQHIESLERAVHEFEAHRYRPPRDLNELVSAGFLAAIPQEPFGGHYVFDAASGRVLSSSGHKPWRLGRSKLREAFLRRQGTEKN